jgi:hypothetical protein
MKFIQITKIKNSTYTRIITLVFTVSVLFTLTLYPGLTKARHSAEWLHHAKWGVMTHFLTDSNMSSIDWNKRVNNFDVESIARQLNKVGASYYIITLGQNSGHYCSPNRTYDKYVGIKPSKCSSRDLISDLYKALNPRGIKLMVYLTAGAPNEDKTAVSKLEWTNGPYRNQAFQIKWENFIREWSLRWGNKVQGWWFDSCYWPKEMYGSSTSPNFKSFSESARAGNSGSIIAFNQGPTYPMINPTEYGDYTAGEINDARGVECDSQWIGKAQLHVLGFLGSNWGIGNKKYTDEEVIRTTQNIVRCGGAMTWDVPIQSNGHIADQFVNQLIKLKQNLDKPLPSLRLKPIPQGNLASFKKAEFLNLDGSRKLPVNSAKHFPAWGVDGNLKTIAMASDEWAWTYQVDLSKIYSIKKTVINFGTSYATEYKVLVSMDRKNWTTIIHNENSRGGKYIHLFSPVKARYIQVKGIKPNSLNQIGTQMSIAEIEVYK